MGTPELETKLSQVREVLERHGLGAARLRGTDWFAWATCGGSSTVLLTAETGVAEVLVTAEGAWVLTDVIEADRLGEEEVPVGLPIWAHAWAEPDLRETFVTACARGLAVASDRPQGMECALPLELKRLRWSLGPEELSRYRSLGKESAEAMTDVLLEAKPDWSGFELAAAACERLWSRGIHPALTLVGDERRLPRHRHATATAEKLGGRAMLVFCARRHGLYANLTRFVYFRPPTGAERQAALDVAQVEAAAWEASRPGATLGDVYAALRSAYEGLGHPGAEKLHHQGGSCGYLARDVVALPASPIRLEGLNAIAWNPSLPGAKIEDTAVVSEGGLEVLTVDSRWPTVEVAGRARPDLLIR